ncbi:MAG: hypothetical protein M1825_003473 [Sarcosagium campestre]|nr:MAG: hypothetical protein M1825_003473 [Sarcosagium campestre]
MAFPTTYHEDSDADDEYERGLLSPQLATDSEASPTDSDPPSTEHTPTTYGHFGGDGSPKTLITEWTATECADFVSDLGLSQYANVFVENEIIGEALIALRHEELKEMGMSSVGHRLTLLKSVYDIKIRQDIIVDPEHYIPLSADAGNQDATATQEDIARLIQSMRLRDERIVEAERELRKVTEEYRKLREELLPIFRNFKDRSQPLPYHPSGYSNDVYGHDSTSQPATQGDKNSNLNRKISTKKFVLGSAPNNASPTHIPHSIQEGKQYNDASMLDPSAAATSASHHLTSAAIGSQQPSPGQANMPSPTSPPHSGPGVLNPRSYNQQPNSGTRSMFSHNDEAPSSYNTLTSTLTSERDLRQPTPTPATSRRMEYGSSETSAPAGNSSAQSVEIFKSFRVSMDDPCFKVLPAALKKYNINADWKQYALYIVYGDEERCLELDEKPLHLFKQLDKEGRKPMFMLRKIAPLPMEPGQQQPSSAGLNSSTSNLAAPRSAYNMGVTPGGVL